MGDVDFGAQRSSRLQGVREPAKLVNDVGESKFAAIVDRHDRMAESGDNR
jgi:hypothetical protein